MDKDFGNLDVKSQLHSINSLKQFLFNLLSFYKIFAYQDY